MAKHAQVGDEFSHLYSPKVAMAMNAPSANLPSLSYEEAGRKIAGSDVTINHNPLGNHANVTYAFYGDSGLPYSKSHGWTLRPNEKEYFKPANAKVKATIEQSLKSWADVADITFTKAADPEKADIKFGAVSNPNIEKSSLVYGGGVTTWSTPDGKPEVWVTMQDTQHPDGRSPGSYNNMTYVHEIGHALGLVHPEGYAENSHGYSVMSYHSETESGQDHKWFSPEGPMLHDISAIQHLYGANTHTRAGDTTYGFNSNSDRIDMHLNSSDDRIVCSVWDTGGYNTFDFSGFKQDQKIDLHEMAFSDVGDLKGNVSIAKGTHIQKVIGGQGNDVLIGNDDHNTIIGNGGNNLIYGGKGGDVLTGGSGHNTYLYGHISDSTVDDPDTITNFKTGQDKIDLTGLYGGHNAAVSYASDGVTGRSGAVIVTESYSENGKDMTNLFLTLDDHSHDHHDMQIKIAGAFNDETDLMLFPA